MRDTRILISEEPVSTYTETEPISEYPFGSPPQFNIFIMDCLVGHPNRVRTSPLPARGQTTWTIKRWPARP